MLRLDPWRARESQKKPPFDPVKVGRCDDLHTIAKAEAIFFDSFLGNANLQKTFSTDSDSRRKISMNPPGFIKSFQV